MIIWVKGTVETKECEDMPGGTVCRFLEAVGM